MKRTKHRLQVCITLLILILIFIWGNSCLPANISGAFSNWVRNLLAPLFGWDPANPNGTGPGALRKIAHLMEFFCLGMCLSWLAWMLRTRKWEVLLPLPAGFLTACIDETIQFFIPGRGPGWLDVGIDTLGVTLGVVIISLFPIVKNRSKFLEETKL